MTHIQLVDTVTPHDRVRLAVINPSSRKVVAQVLLLINRHLSPRDLPVVVACPSDADLRWLISAMQVLLGVQTTNIAFGAGGEHAALFQVAVDHSSANTSPLTPAVLEAMSGSPLRTSCSVCGVPRTSSLWSSIA